MEIANNEDLREALLYFSPSTTLTADDHLTMRVEVSVDSSISLSDYEGSEWKSGYASSNAASSSSEDSFMKGRYAERNSTLRSSSSPNPMTQRDNKLYGTIPSRTYTSSQSHNAFPELSELEDVTELVNSPVSRQMFSSVDNTEEWDKGKEELCQKWYDACRNDLESLQIGFSPSPIPSSISSRSWDASQRMSSSNSDSGNSVDTRALRLRKPRIPRFEEADETNIHHGIRCRSCGIYPIIGIRYHCASCTRPADFVRILEPKLTPMTHLLSPQCVNCERTGQAERNSPSHSTSHMMIKITIPLQGTQAAQHLNMVLQGLKTRLVQEARSSTLSLSNPPETETAAAAARENTTDQTLPEHALKCSFCSRTITQVRYLCANCPIVTQSTRDGYNLCTTCEMASLQCHDPTHFFLKINIITRQGYRPDDSRRVALADRWEVRETSGSGPLLPQLYIHSDDLHLPTSLDSRNCVVRIGDGIRVEENADGRSILIGDQASGISIDRHGIQFGSRRFLSPPQTNDLQNSIELRGLRTSPSRQIVPMENLVHA